MAIFANTNQIQQGFAFVNRGSSGFQGSKSNGISIVAENGGLKIITPFSRDFVDELKEAVPATSRKWDPPSKAWLVSKQYSSVIKEIVDRVYSCDVAMPTVIATDTEAFEVELQIDYLANCKNEAASAHCNGGWNAKFPENVLRRWFKQAETVNQPATFYGVLGLDQKATDADIKKAYKRAARQWHPDICREENAREMFESIKDAYQVLSNPSSRSKYNAGLAFERMAKTGRNSHFQKSKYSTFTPMIRCGKLKVRATRELGVIVVEEILKWDDIENELGQIMVSFWAGDSWSMAWV